MTGPPIQNKANHRPSYGLGFAALNVNPRQSWRAKPAKSQDDMVGETSFSYKLLTAWPSLQALPSQVGTLLQFGACMLDQGFKIHPSKVAATLAAVERIKHYLG